MPRLKERGKNTFDSEITGITKSGLWLLYDGREYFIPFENYPSLKKASVQGIYEMEVIGPGQLRWDSIDCDIEISALDSPESYPLQYKD